VDKDGSHPTKKYLSNNEIFKGNFYLASNYVLHYSYKKLETLISNIVPSFHHNMFLGRAKFLELMCFVGTVNRRKTAPHRE
jgi:hypothetical protein